MYRCDRRNMQECRNGLAWTLAAAHGISPQRPGDSVWVITRTADGFLAAGANGITRQAPAWTSRDGVTGAGLTSSRGGFGRASVARMGGR